MPTENTNTILLDVLTGLHNSISGVNTHFVEYDEELSGLVNSVESLEVPNIDSIETETISYEVKPKINVLSGSAVYSLEDGKIYRANLTQDTDFILPNVEGESNILHEIILTVKFDGYPYYAVFKDVHGQGITTMDGDNNNWSSGDVVQYLCRYEVLVEKWVIMPMKLY